MHQQSRHPPRVYSPASSPQTNPARTNNPRDRIRTAASSDTASQDGGSEGAESFESGPSKESIKKLDQIIQNFYTKAAVLVLQSRLNTTPVGARRGDGKKANQWFSIETDEIEDFRDELRVFRTSGSFENRPPPMIIETYIDASRLSSSQSLVILDNNGKRWDVLEALNSSETSDDSPRKRQAQKRNTDVILERWRFELKCLPDVKPEEFGPALPGLYKKAIVFFRSLFVTTRIMPCWKYSRQALAKGGIHPALEVKCRVLSAEPEYTTYDPLRQPLHDGREAVTEYIFPDVELPMGRLYGSLTYRKDCSFRVDDAESLLSSRFMGVDENYFKPSVPQRREHGRSDSFAEPGSLPSHRQGRGPLEPQQTYGSLSTFHGEGALGTSPITALRSVRPVGSDTSSPSASLSASIEQQPEPPHSLPIRGAVARPGLRTFEGSSRRPSVSFQPFKAGSLSGSPRVPDLEAPSSPQSLTRPSLAGPSRAGNRSSLVMGMAASLRGPSAPQDVPSVTGSPRPASRYSSSFTHRRGRPSFGGQSRGDDDQASSGKQSLSSSAQPGSGLLAEAGGIASSGSFATDDDNISEFLKALDSGKTLKSFEPNKKGESAASKRTAAQLSKFQLMRDSNNALTDSMTSSIHLQRSSTSSSRQLPNVPTMANPASMSISSSPGKPLSPHTPHTPAIPSRLSENSIIDYQAPEHGSVGRHRPGRGGREEEPVEEEDEDEEQGSTAAAAGTSGPATSTTSPKTATTTSTATTAIDIPLSPRLLLHPGGNRRASSVAHPQRSIDDASYHHHHRHGHHQHPHPRSASVEGAEGSAGAATGSGAREVPGLSSLLAFQREQGALPGSGGEARRSGSLSTSAPSVETEAEGSSATAAAAAAASGSHHRYHHHNRATTAPGTGTGTSDHRHHHHHHHRPRPGSGSFLSSSSAAAGGGNRYAGSVEGADEEPLLFAMSELERDSRRSLEEGRGGGSGSGSSRLAGVGGTGVRGGGGEAASPGDAGAGVGEEGGSVGSGGGGGNRYEPRGVLRKGWS